jgi:hypothetical protein
MHLTILVARSLFLRTSRSASVSMLLLCSGGLQFTLCTSAFATVVFPFVVAYVPTSSTRATAGACCRSVKVTGLAQKLGQLEAVHRDFQSKYWANLKLLGQPCNFRAGGRAAADAGVRRSARGGGGAPRTPGPGGRCEPEIHRVGP